MFLETAGNSPGALGRLPRELLTRGPPAHPAGPREIGISKGQGHGCRCCFKHSIRLVDALVCYLH